MIKFLKIFLAMNCIFAGIISILYVLACFVTWSIVPVWTLDDIRPETFRLIELALAFTSFFISLDPDLEV